MVAGTGDEAWEAAAFRRLLGTPGCFGLLAIDAGDEPAGFILIRTVGSEAEILALAVAPARWRRGIGRKLLEAGLQAARESGASRILLEVAIDNASARRLYRQVGFAEVGRRPGYYRRPGRPPADSLVMAWSRDAAAHQGQLS